MVVLAKSWSNKPKQSNVAWKCNPLTKMKPKIESFPKHFSRSGLLTLCSTAKTIMIFSVCLFCSLVRPQWLGHCCSCHHKFFVNQKILTSGAIFFGNVFCWLLLFFSLFSPFCIYFVSKTYPGICLCFFQPNFAFYCFNLFFSLSRSFLSNYILDFFDHETQYCLKMWRWLVVADVRTHLKLNAQEIYSRFSFVT